MHINQVIQELIDEELNKVIFTAESAKEERFKS